MGQTRDLKNTAQQWDLATWIHECSKLYPQQLVELVSLATPETDAATWKEKLHELLTHFPSNLSLESFGRALNAPQALEILQFLATPEQHLMSRQQLSSLFVGLSPLVFRKIIEHATEQQLYFFKEEALTEVIQHHLSLIAHEFNKELTDVGNDIQTAEAAFRSLSFGDLNSKEIANLYLTIEQLETKANDLLKLVNQTLIIAWNSHRIDLIQELGRIKELCQRCLLEHIGRIADQKMKSSGLRYVLQEAIDLHFSDRDADGNVTLMKETTPALEALVKLSIWHLQDYHDIGLIEGVPPMPELDTHPSQADRAALKMREHLLTVAERNLNRLGLHSLRDLKAARIYSKQSLMEYIKERTALL